MECILIVRCGLGSALVVIDELTVMMHNGAGMLRGEMSCEARMRPDRHGGRVDEQVLVGIFVSGSGAVRARIEETTDGWSAAAARTEAVRCGRSRIAARCRCELDAVEELGELGSGRPARSVHGRISVVDLLLAWMLRRGDGLRIAG